MKHLMKLKEVTRYLWWLGPLAAICVGAAIAITFTALGYYAWMFLR